MNNNLEKGDRIFNRIYVLLKETNGEKTPEIIKLQKELASLKVLLPSVKKDNENVIDQIVLDLN